MYNYLKEHRTKILLIPLILYWLFIFIGTSLPSDNISTIIEIGDKVKHFFAYFILASLLSLNLHFQNKWNTISVNYIFFTLLICTFYGIFDELHQMYVPNRSAEFYDFLADFFGSTTGAFLVYFFVRIIKKRSELVETN